MTKPVRLASVALICWIPCACDKGSDEQGAAPPPPVPTAKPGLCKGGGGTVTDKVSAAHLMRKIGDYCIDPNGETRAYGQDAPGELDKVCTELFNGECEVYKSYGLERVVTVRYVDGAGSPGSVNVNLSRFDTGPHAYGFFTKRVVAGADPLEAAPDELSAGGVGAIGTGIAYVWRGKHVVELSYTNELETPEQIKTSSQKVLPGLARSIGDRLPGDKKPPEAVAQLPTKDRVRLGISYTPHDVLSIAGAGPGALGYYKKGEVRWRVLSLVRPDDAAAKDVIKTLRKLEGAKRLDGPPVAVAFPLRDDDATPPTRWVVTRKDDRVVGIGDETYAPKESSRLNVEQKLTLLKELLAEPSKNTASPSR